MKIRILDDSPANAEAWDHYVAGNPNALSDHMWNWRHVLGEAFGFKEQYYLAAEEKGRLAGILPLYRIPRGLTRSVLTSIPFGNYGGILADSEDAEKLLLGAAAETLKKTGGEFLELRHKTPILNKILRQSEHTHSRFFLPLKGDSDYHFRELSRQKRNNIKKAMQSGLEAVFSRDINMLYPLHVHTTRRQGIPCFPKIYFQKILDEFGDRAGITFAFWEGRPIAYHLNLNFKGTLICQFAGSLEEYYKSYPNEFLFWTDVQQACSLGLKEYDLCCSRADSGTAEYKRQMRLTEEPLDNQYFFRKEGRTPFSQKAQGGMKRRNMMRIWQHLPVTITTALGPEILKYFA